MKVTKIISIICLGALIASCKKFEQVPNESINSDIVYDEFDKNATIAGYIRNDLYTYLPNGFNRIQNVVLDAATDDAVASAYRHQIELLSKSGITASNNPDNRWATSYQAVRKVNLFLSNLDIVPSAQATKNAWKAEARFIRAINYFELLKRYGGVPLLGDTVFKLTDNLTNIPRNSFNEVVQYIVSECDAIKGSLTTEPLPQGIPHGTITRGAALALKSRTLLYAASPLNNPENDLAKWQAAAAAAKELIDLGKFSLSADFRNTFTTRSNSEVILAYQRPQIRDLETLNAPVGYAEPNASRGYVSPSQNLVDAFPMSDGRPITASSTSVPYNPQNPYANRDPRLAATVFYNGISWLSRPVETFEGGLDKPGGITLQTRTGYYMQKFLGNFSTSTAYSDQTHNFPIFRYAEILLNYAEALNEAADLPANRTLALAQLTALRSRAKIPAGNTAGFSYGLKTNMTQAEMREAIRNERRIEMAFEEQRFWDIRRWKIAGAVGNADIKGLKIVKQPNNTFTYTPVVVDKLVFTPKMYLYPIPLNETLANPSITQNPGY